MNHPSHCPHCLHEIDSQPGREVQAEFCGHCGTFWLDFSQRRPALYHAVEAQAARWEKLHPEARLQAV